MQLTTGTVGKCLHTIPRSKEHLILNIKDFIPVGMIANIIAFVNYSTCKLVAWIKLLVCIAMNVS